MMRISSVPHVIAAEWYDQFSKYAEDLYPGRYTYEKCLELAEMAVEIAHRAAEKQSTVVVHNYLYPEFHEIADYVGDSLGLSFKVRDAKATRVDFESVYFMGATAKIITGDATRVFVPDKPQVIGCSLVFGTNYEWIENWKRETGGVLVTYINSDAYVKSISEFISTSRNTDKVIVAAAKLYPGKKILVLPDKYLGYVMKIKAVDHGVDPKLIEVYDHDFNHERACCYVHEKIGEHGLAVALMTHPNTILMIHPECGCAASCMLKLQQGIIPHEQAYFLSTEGMVEFARASAEQKFLVATEKGMLYRLRKEMPDKQFIPISYEAECGYMKACTFQKLLASLQKDTFEIVLCDDCCDPKNPLITDNQIHIQRSVAEKAKIAIQRMMSIV